MEIRIQSVKFDADVKLTDYINKKVAKLDRFFDGIIAAEVSLSLTPDHENKKVAIRLEIPGYDVMAERSKACSVFVRSEAGVMGPNPTQGIDI